MRTQRNLRNAVFGPWLGGQGRDQENAREEHRLNQECGSYKQLLTVTSHVFGLKKSRFEWLFESNKDLAESRGKVIVNLSSWVFASRNLSRTQKNTRVAFEQWMEYFAKPGRNEKLSKPDESF